MSGQSIENFFFSFFSFGYDTIFFLYFFWAGFYRYFFRCISLVTTTDSFYSFPHSISGILCFPLQLYILHYRHNIMKKLVSGNFIKTFTGQLKMINSIYMSRTSEVYKKSEKLNVKKVSFVFLFLALKKKKGLNFVRV